MFNPPLRLSGVFLFTFSILFGLAAEEEAALTAEASRHWNRFRLELAEDIGALSGEALYDTLLQLAETAELTGALSEALDYYERASLVPGEPRRYKSLLRAGLLLLEMGEWRQAESRGKAVRRFSGDPALREAGFLLSCRSRILQGTMTPGEAAEEYLKQGGPESSRGFYTLLSWLDPQRDAALTARIEKRWAEAYPESPDRLVRNGSAERLPSPVAILEGREGDVKASEGAGRRESGNRQTGEAANSPQERDPREDGEAEWADIQIASFRKEENAVSFRQRMAELGWQTVIREKRVGGVDYYRVLIPEVPLESLQDEVKRLKDSGMEAYPLY